MVYASGFLLVVVKDDSRLGLGCGCEFVMLFRLGGWVNGLK